MEISQRYRRLDSSTQAEYLELCERAQQDHWRQWFHIQPPAGLLNDPNGFVFHQGKYFLYYQWFPLAPVHGLKYWRGVSGDNLATLKDTGIFLSPDSDADSHGAYSGSALSNGNHVLIAYTGNHRTSDWQRIPYQTVVKMDNNQIISDKKVILKDAPQGYTEHVRDPKIWREENGSYAMLLGAQRENKTGAALYLTSNDGEDWQLKGEIDFSLPDFGYMWECPEYFSLQNQDIVIICPQGLNAEDTHFRNLYQCGYLAGAFDRKNLMFKHSGFKELDLGFEFYATQSTIDADEERALIAWFGLPDVSTPSADNGWAHCLTLPRRLTWKENNLYQQPHPDLQKLRGNNNHDGVHFELIVENELNQPFELNFRCDENYQTTLFFDGNRFVFDRSKSGVLPQLEKDILNKGGNVRELFINEITHLQIFSDSSSLEIFINHGAYVFSGRIFPPETATQFNFNLGSHSKYIIYPIKENLNVRV